MGGSTKKILGGVGIGALAALTGGIGAAALGGALGLGAGAGAVGAGTMATLGATGAAAGASMGASMASADKQAAIQREANKQMEIQQKREAGMAPTATNQGDTITDTLRKKSAIRRSILTGTTKTAQKLGD